MNGKLPESGDCDEGVPLIELRGLGVCYRRQARQRTSVRELLSLRFSRGELLWALRGIDLICSEGQVLGVVGANGAGKSTLCMALAHILTPDEGEAIVRGKVSTLLTLGAGFNRDLSGRDNILLYGAFLGIERSRIQGLVDAIIDFAELRDAIEEPVRNYSSGMRARLAFSVATALEPEILVLDEVLSVGDRAFRAKSRARIEELMAASKLIVLVSHSQSFLRSLCTHALWLDRGAVRQYGPASEVLDAYEAATDGEAARR
ncbi:MAG: ABC transporter ATP-binding protein [Planctomycetota bacterium]